MSTNHTPGPWAATGHDGKRNIIVESASGSIAAVWDTGATDFQHANARLIAASPDLLGGSVTVRFIIHRKRHNASPVIPVVFRRC